MTELAESNVSTDKRASRSFWDMAAFGGLAACALLLFALGLAVPLHGTEREWFVGTTALHSPFTVAQAAGLLPHAPLSLFGLALNTWGTVGDPLPLRLIQLLFHTLNAVLIYRVLRRLIALPGASVYALAAAFAFLAGGAAFASVNYVAARPATQATFFALLAVQFYLRATESGTLRAGQLVCSAGAYLLAVGSHAGALPLPLALAALDWSRGRWKTAASYPGEWIFFAALMIFAGHAGRMAHAASENGLPAGSFSAALHYAAVALKTLAQPGNVPLSSPAEAAPLWTLKGIVALVPIVVLTVFAVAKRNAGAAGWVWFLGAAAMAWTGLLPLADLLTPQSVYLPLAGLFLAIPPLLVVPQHQSVRIASCAFFTGFAAVAGLLPGLGTPWISPADLWEQQAARHPESATAALRHAAHFSLDQSANAQGEDRFAWLGRSEADWRKVLASSETPEALANLGKALYSQGKKDEALGQWLRALRLDPYCIEASTAAGMFYAERMQGGANRESVRNALEHFGRLERMKALPPETLLPYGAALGWNGEYERALDLWKQYPSVAGDPMVAQLSQQFGQDAARRAALARQESELSQQAGQASAAMVARADRLIMDGRLAAAVYTLEAVTSQPSADPRAAELLQYAKSQLSLRKPAEVAPGTPPAPFANQPATP